MSDGIVVGFTGTQQGLRNNRSRLLRRCCGNRPLSLFIMGIVSVRMPMPMA